MADWYLVQHWIRPQVSPVEPVGLCQIAQPWPHQISSISEYHSLNYVCVVLCALGGRGVRHVFLLSWK